MKSAKRIDHRLTKQEAIEAITSWLTIPAGYRVERVDFKIAEVDGDPLDRYPGHNDVVEVSVSLISEEAVSK